MKGVASTKNVLSNKEFLMKTTQIALAIATALGMMHQTVWAADYPLNVTVPQVDEVNVYPSDDNGKGYVTIQESAGADVVIDRVVFNPANADFGDYTIGYVKHEGQNLTVKEATVKAGTAQKLTVGDFEFWGNRIEGSTAPQSITVEKLIVEENAALRINESTYNGAHAENTTFTAVDVYLNHNAGVAFGGGLPDNKEGATDQRLGTVWAGYDADGTMLEAKENSVTGIVAVTTANKDGKAFSIGTLNVGETSFVTDSTASDAIPNLGSSFGLGETEVSGIDGNAVNVNLNGATSQAKLGTVTSDVNVNFSDKTLGGTLAKGEKNLSVENLQKGTLTATAKNTGADAQTQFEGLADRISVQSTPAEGGDAVNVDYNMSLAASGIHDGLTATWDADANEDLGGVANVRAGEENGVTHGLSQLAAVGYMQWRSAMNHMQYRLGEIRDQNGYNNGGWVRVYNGKDEFGSQNVENKYYGAQLGYDHKIAGTNVLVGGAFSYTRGESTFDLGEGDNYNYDFTLYGTWLADSGFYLDGTIKYGALSNDVTFDHNDIVGGGTASYDTNAIGVSAEAGWRFPVTNFAYVEPQAEVMYGHIWSADYNFNGIDVTNEAVDMTVGRLGVQAGLQCPNKKGGAYVRASVLHDFQGDADVTFRQGADKVTLNEELGDTWYELGIGANWNVTESTYVYADFNYTDGGEVESPWRWSVGVRMAW